MVAAAGVFGEAAPAAHENPAVGALTGGLELVADEGEQLAEDVTIGHGPGQEAVVYAGGFHEQVGARREVGSLWGTGRHD